MKYIFITLLFILLFASCKNSKVSCDECSEIKQSEWSSRASSPYKELILNNNVLLFQNTVRNSIDILSKKNGSLVDRISGYTSESNKGSYISLNSSGPYLVYEKIIDQRLSYLKIYNYLNHVFIDSIALNISSDNSEFKSSQKISFKPIITGSQVIFGLNDGNLNCYNYQQKKEVWKITHGGGVIFNQSVISKDKLYVEVYKSQLTGSGSLVCCVSLVNGKILWKKFIDDLRIPLIRKGNTLCGIDDNGKVLSFSMIDGGYSFKTSILEKPLSVTDIPGTDLIAVSLQNRKIAVLNTASGKSEFSFEVCDDVYKMAYSFKSNLLFFQDESGHLMKIDLSNQQAKCVTDHLNIYSRFAISQDSIFVNGNKEIQLVKF